MPMSELSSGSGGEWCSVNVIRTMQIIITTTLVSVSTVELIGVGNSGYTVIRGGPGVEVGGETG